MLPQETAPAPLLVDSRTAARLLGVSQRTLHSLRRAGRLRAVNVTAWAIRYSTEDLRAFIEGARETAVGAA